MFSLLRESNPSSFAAFFLLCRCPFFSDVQQPVQRHTFPAEAFAASVDQGAAVVVINTGLEEVRSRSVLGFAGSPISHSSGLVRAPDYLAYRLLHQCVSVCAVDVPQPLVQSGRSLRRSSIASTTFSLLLFIGTNARYMQLLSLGHDLRKLVSQNTSLLVSQLV